MMDRWQAAKARFWVMGMPILIGVFLLILAAMGIFYFQQQRERDSLDVQVGQLTKLVENPVEPSEELKEKYAQTQKAVPSELETGDVISDVRSIAQENGFDVISPGAQDVTITPGDVRKENVEGKDYEVLTFVLDVSGEYDQVRGFIFDLDSTTRLETLVIESLDIDIAEDSATAILEFGVYVLKE